MPQPRHCLLVVLLPCLMHCGCRALPSPPRSSFPAGETAVVSGTIVGPDDRPFPGATVHCWIGSMLDFFDFPASPPLSTITDAAGRFSCAARKTRSWGFGFAVATAPGYCMASGRISSPGTPGAKDLVLRMKPGGVTTSGMVVDADYRPVANARISIMMLEPPRSDTVRMTDPGFFGNLPVATTKSDGTFAIADLPPNFRVHLTCTAPGLAGGGIGRITTGWPDILIRMAPEAIASGRVLAHGRGAPDVKVFIGGKHTTTGADGRWEVRIGSGVTTLALQPPDALAYLVQEHVPIRPGRRVRFPDQELPPLGTVRGRVTRSDTDAPLKDAMVMGFPGDNKTEAGGELLFGMNATRTDADGRYSLRTPVGKFTAHATPGENHMLRHPATPEKRELTLAAGQTVDHVDFAFSSWSSAGPVSIEGRVLLPDGKPASDVIVSMIRGWLWSDAAITDARGRFSLSVREARERPEQFTLAAVDRIRGFAGLFEATTGAATPMIKLGPAAYVRAKVIDTRGKPVEGVAVGVRLVSPTRSLLWFPASRYERSMGAGMIEARMHTDAAGMVRSGPLPSGATVKLQLDEREDGRLVTAPDALPAIKLIAGKTHQPPALVLQREGRRLTGTVVNEQGRPVPDALIFGTGEGEYARAGQDGRFELLGLPDRKPVRIIACYWLHPLFASVVLQPGKWQPVQLVLRPACTFEGTITDAAGSPPPFARIMLNPTGLGMYYHPLMTSRLMQTEGSEVFADERGHWRATNLIGGLQYEIRASDTDYSAGNWAHGPTIRAVAGKTIQVPPMKWGQ